MKASILAMASATFSGRSFLRTTMRMSASDATPFSAFISAWAAWCR